ncbi:MAG: EscU/YscU/HrcU family type III secretion system export apparatus switch protein [Cystobacterineae bacterium]|nr:EscU/YscU/HrcU family type III secretion system export apparatus switch protein [Cystobacterineae bacterium]
MDEGSEIAIALKYDKEQDSAPRVIAKGLKLRADKIREIAKANNIPVLRNVSLAEALFRVEVGQEIPESLYDAVAEILNFVYSLSQQNAPLQRK